MLDRIRSKNLHTWLPGYGRHLVRRLRSARERAAASGPRHLLFALCDHYEPLWNKVSVAQGEARVAAWERGYPDLVRDFRDADGKRPQHSFFFPGEEYQPQFLDALAKLAKDGYGEVELHLHHDGDTAATLRASIEAYLATFAEHGHLSRDPDGRIRYAFIHGNWCLANSRADGRWCGVDEEIPLLWDTGCYVDMTFPSAPNECQPNVVNQIYWPVGDLARRRAYEQAEPARVGRSYDDRLLMITGPLALARRPGRLSVRIESSALDDTDPPGADRLRTWVDQDIHVAGRPEWVFVKVHTHGCPEKNAAVLLGDAGRELHQTLTTRYNDGRRWVLHYVTAREMYNIAKAAIAGKSGNPNDYRDFEIPPPPVVG
jgi:hypothetical protein